MKGLKMKYSNVNKTLSFVGSKEFAKNIKTALGLINCDDIDCGDCPFDTLQGCALNRVTNALDNVETE